MNTYVVIDKIFAEMVDDSNDRFLTQLIIYSRPLPLTANKHETKHHMCTEYIYQFTTHQSVYVVVLLVHTRPDLAFRLDFIRPSNKTFVVKKRQGIPMCYCS